jgi:hypothetical protein
LKSERQKLEAVDIVKCKTGLYVNALFLANNEFGVNVFMPVELAPQVLLRDLSYKNQTK